MKFAGGSSCIILLISEDIFFIFLDWDINFKIVLLFDIELLILDNTSNEFDKLIISLGFDLLVEILDIILCISETAFNSLVISESVIWFS